MIKLQTILDNGIAHYLRKLTYGDISDTERLITGKILEFQIQISNGFAGSTWTEIAQSFTKDFAYVNNLTIEQVLDMEFPINLQDLRVKRQDYRANQLFVPMDMEMSKVLDEDLLKGISI